MAQARIVLVDAGPVFTDGERTLMAQIIRLQDLSTEEISRLLAANSRRLTDDHEWAAQRCAGEIVRVKKACDALKTLRFIEEAA